jgi:hypothetical protein
MITIRYSLTPEDLAELEAERRGGLFLRILRIPTGALIGLAGLFLTLQAIFFFPWNHWIGNLLIAALGIFLLWMGLDYPGLKWLSRRFFHPRDERELQIYEGGIVCSSRGKTQYLRRLPHRGFRENGKFLFLRASDAEFAIPKHAVTPEQEKKLRELVQQEAARTAPQESTRGDAIECSFFLAQDELNEASALCHRSFIERWLSTKYGRVFGRAFCGFGALAVFGLPVFMGKSWTEEFRNEPGVAVGLVGLGLFYLFAAAGCPGLRAQNHLDLERRIRISGAAVEVTRGTKTLAYKWKRFFSYHETPTLFVLRTQFVVRFWTVPKRSLQPGDEGKLRALLDRKLPRQ